MTASNNAAPDDRPPAPWSRASVIAFLRRLGPAGILAVIASALPFFGELALIGVIAYLSGWLRTHPHLGPALYTSLFALTAGLAMLPTHIQSLLGGYAFGFRIGAPCAIAAVSAASLLCFAIARRASGHLVLRLINEHAKWRVVNDALLHGSFWRTLLIVTLVRVPPSSPFALTNLVLASTRVPLPAYLLGSVIGLAPRTAVVVYLGSVGKDLTSSAASGKWMLVISVVLALIVIAVIGHIANKALAHVTRPDATSDDQTGRAA